MDLGVLSCVSVENARHGGEHRSSGFETRIHDGDDMFALRARLG